MKSNENTGKNGGGCESELPDFAQNYTLDSRIDNSSYHLVNLPLCEVRLKENAMFPWLILIPRCENITEIMDLTLEQQNQLMQELSVASQVMRNVYQPDKLNVGALGNIVAQLHIHVVARFQMDALWPHGVWQATTPELRYEQEKLVHTIERLSNHFAAKNLGSSQRS